MDFHFSFGSYVSAQHFHFSFLSSLTSPPAARPFGHQDYDQLAKDFTGVFLNIEPSCLQNAHLFDVVFLVGQSKQKARFIGVRAILGVRSRVFQVNNHPSPVFRKITSFPVEWRSFDEFRGILKFLLTQEFV